MKKQPNPVFNYKTPLLKQPRSKHISVIPLTTKTYTAWKKKQKNEIKNKLEHDIFSAKPKETLIVRNKNSDIEYVLAGINTPCTPYDLSHTAAHIRDNIPNPLLKTVSFEIDIQKFTKDEHALMHLGWLMSGYTFSRYKDNALETPKLVAHPSIDIRRISSMAEALFFTRNLINTPTNDMGPADMESAARHIAEKHNAKIQVITDKALLKKNFPLIYTVGEAAADDRRPRLIDIQWGKTKDPKVTLVGKGVCFDTGGLNIKPTAYMKLMKKDMGGAAHVLGLAWLIMALKLPIKLRVLVPTVENSISGPAFRPGDVLKSRKGVFVENTNTDAEGRLILADALAYACEDKPELLIDFATLTGSARAALGHDIPAMFSTNDKLANKLRDISMDVQDPVWPMPLWQPYQKHIESTCGNIVNSAGNPGDLIYSALLLERFLPNETKDRPDWIHLDTFAWQAHGHPGRPNGGSDCGLRAIWSLLEQKYG